METKELDQTKSEAFAEKLIDTMNSGALALMISIGHRTGLYDTMNSMRPATSHEIASEAGLNERYVREWLGAMVTGNVIEYSPVDATYSLPPEHAAWMTRSSTPDNIAVFAQYIPLLGSVEDRIVECFQKGGGVPYSEFNRFHEVMAEDSGQTVVSSLTDSILPLVPDLEDRLDSGIAVLDVGCGSGRAINLMAQTFPNSKFTGYDFCEEGITVARAEADSLGLSNIKFEAKDVTALDHAEQFDLITAFDAIHDQIKPADVLKGIADALHPDGVFLMQDISASSHLHKNLDHPIGPFLYTISCMHCMTVSLASNGEGLGTVWGEEKAVEMLREAGFKKIEVKKLDHDFQNNYYINKKR
jgi:2-polyprenyl-3-methyl-5-hydroxy-6-metoxy-1,4-benzoquinol methylase